MDVKSRTLDSHGSDPPKGSPSSVHSAAPWVTQASAAP